MTALEANAQRKLRKAGWQWPGLQLPLVTTLLEYSKPHLSCQPLSPQRERERDENREDMGWERQENYGISSWKGSYRTTEEE